MDALDNANSHIFDEQAMEEALPEGTFQRFKESLVKGDATSESDMEAIASAIFKWARARGAVSFAHWFFPVRGGGGAPGGAIGAFKTDTLLDYDYSVKNGNKRFKQCLPAERFFFGETDGSSFPNGGLRATHTAAAFTTWDRSSPCFVLDKVLRIPCSFVSHLGACLDDKTPLLRSNDALNREGLRLLKAIKIGEDAKCLHSYLGWEQEFFVVKAEHYRARPDLVNCGRTLIGALPPRNQNGDLNYFGPIPNKVVECLENIQAVMLKLGVPMCVMHNEVAPAQHEMSPIYCKAQFSCDNNALFMEVCAKESAKLGLHILFHEKPFAGINGSGKHNNWSVGTDTGLNFFYPGKTDSAREFFVTGIACLAHGLKEHNSLVRCAVAHAGNDHRLGAQEAPPAIISLYPGTGFEAHVDSIIAGGPLLGYKAEKRLADPKATSAMGAPCGIEDRNRTAPFPFCGNRFEFRAVGSSQNCSFPIAIINTVMASGMAKIAGLIEGGATHRDAVAQVYKESRGVIFTGNCYSAEWPEDAKKRGLPNDNTTPAAIAKFATDANKKVMGDMKVFSAEECEARQEVMYENYSTCLISEVHTLVHMVETGILPACAKDMASYGSMKSLAGVREETYNSIKTETVKLQQLFDQKPHDLAKEAEYLCNTVKPQMSVVRGLVDKAEGLLEKGLYPYPTYEEILYSHHS